MTDQKNDKAPVWLRSIAGVAAPGGLIRLRFACFSVVRIDVLAQRGTLVVFGELVIRSPRRRKVGSSPREQVIISYPRLGSVLKATAARGSAQILVLNAGRCLTASL